MATHPEFSDEADHFLKHEREFRLGVLPTEQPHPKTRDFSRVVRADLGAGIRMLQSVDLDILPMADRVLASRPFAVLVAALADALRNRKRICLSGCGATGRLSILLEAAWRRRWRTLKQQRPALAGERRDGEDRVISLMTGGDFALVRSVESFEDFAAFGREQVREAGLGAGDVLVAITEGGETSSVIGTAWQALEQGATVFFVCNNPLDLLARHVARSRAVIRAPRIVTLDISTGPMAIAGSTRMQATTAELLIVGAALEMALARFLARPRPGRTPEASGRIARQARRYGARFAALLRELGQPAAVSAIGRMVAWEESVYRRQSAVTYFADRYLLDIFTDTTERAPTFMLPPFRKRDDTAAPRSWAFVKCPTRSTPEAWADMLKRPLRCLNWSSDRYQALGAPERIWRTPPRLDPRTVLKFAIGNEDDPSRYTGAGDAALLVADQEELAGVAPGGRRLLPAFRDLASKFPLTAALALGAGKLAPGRVAGLTSIPCRAPASPLDLWKHLAVKLVFNTLSTATMARLGRVAGNWMIHVETTNKKLIDRGTRLVAELTGVSYARACHALLTTRAELMRRPDAGAPKPSPVALTIERLRRRRADSGSARAGGVRSCEKIGRPR